MLKNMGMPNGMLALYTGMLYFPWVVKPLWSPFVDIIRSKRWWILSMQILMSIAMLILPFMLPHETGASLGDSSLFFITLAIFWVTAFASASNKRIPLPVKQAEGFFCIKKGVASATPFNMIYYSSS